jgi:REP element-mobilizing transposase RayT
MARPLRIEYAGAFYHLTARGNARQAIFLSDDNRRKFLQLLATAVERYNWRVHAYCLMDNHYHLVVETVDDTLSKGMKFINGSYSQYFNRQHERVGHVFQGRFKSILVEKDSYLLELCRYVVRNPVRAEMVTKVKDWPWSNYLALIGGVKRPPWLAVDFTLAQFGGSKGEAIKKYRQFVKKGAGANSPWLGLKNQIFLGSDRFVEAAQKKLGENCSLEDVPKAQRSAQQKPLSFYADNFPKKEAMAKAYLSGHYTLTQVGEHFGVSYATVSRATKALENVKCKA